MTVKAIIQKKNRSLQNRNRTTSSKMPELRAGLGPWCLWSFPSTPKRATSKRRANMAPNLDAVFSKSVVWHDCSNLQLGNSPSNFQWEKPICILILNGCQKNKYTNNSLAKLMELWLPTVLWKKSCTNWYVSISRYLQGFIHVGWCSIFSINRSLAKDGCFSRRKPDSMDLLYSGFDLVLTLFNLPRLTRQVCTYRTLRISSTTKCL